MTYRETRPHDEQLAEQKRELGLDENKRYGVPRLGFFGRIWHFLVEYVRFIGETFNPRDVKNITMTIRAVLAELPGWLWEAYKEARPTRTVYRLRDSKPSFFGPDQFYYKDFTTPDSRDKFWKSQPGVMGAVGRTAKMTEHRQVRKLFRWRDL